MSKSVVERVKNLKINNPRTCYVHQYDAIDGEWRSHHLNHDETKDIVVDKDWLPQQIDEFILVNVLMMEDCDMSFVMDINCIPHVDTPDEITREKLEDYLWSGWEVSNDHETNRARTIQFQSDRGHLAITILEWV